MKWVILMVRNGTTLEDFGAALSPHFRTPIDQESKTLWAISHSDTNAQVRIHHWPDGADCYDEPHELEALSTLSDNPEFYLANYYQIHFLRDVLSQLVQEVDMIIDDDYGIIEDGKVFCSRWLENPDWDFAAMTARACDGAQP